MPFWPLGLPGWTDSWIALGMRAPDAVYLTVWHRGPQPGTGADQPRLTVQLPDLRCEPLVARVLYPPGPGAEASWDAILGTLTAVQPAALRGQ